MNHLEARKLWVEALRSGKYEQGRYVLQRNGKFCCLGVACEVYQKSVGDLEIKSEEDMVNRISYDGMDDMLPEKVANWLQCGYDPVVFEDNALSYLNDVEYLTFEQIADIIEAKL